MATYNYQNLQVWQKAMELVEEIYKVAAQLPRSELYALSNQMKRAAISIPSNIAEGQKRLSRNETVHFTGVALGSLAELETQLILGNKIYGLNIDRSLELCMDVGKMSTALVKALRSSPKILRSKI